MRTQVGDILRFFSAVIGLGPKGLDLTFEGLDPVRIRPPGRVEVFPVIIYF